MTALPKSPEIIDIIIHDTPKPWPSKRMYLVLDSMPAFRYERRDDMLLATDGVFYKAYKYERPIGSSKAFAGARFDIPMIDGTMETAYGQWWYTNHPDPEGITLIEPGMNTPEQLAKYNVFMGGIGIDKKAVHRWLEMNQPAIDYHKYAKRQNSSEVTA